MSKEFIDVQKSDIEKLFKDAVKSVNIVKDNDENVNLDKYF